MHAVLPSVEIQRLDAVKLHGPHAVRKDISQRLLDDGCQHRTGRHEEDGCWPNWTAQFSEKFHSRNARSEIMVEDEETATVRTSPAKSARHCLPLRPEQERNRTTIVPLLNRGNLTDHG
jgi:hypothetical protein